MFRLPRIVGLLLVAALVGTACGRGLDESASGTTLPPPTTTTSTTTTTIDLEPVETPTLTVWVEPEYVATVASIGADFTTALGVEVVVEGRTQDQIEDALATGTIAADIFAASHRLLPDAIGRSAVAELPIGARAGEFMEPALAALTADGLLYGIPYKLETKALFFDPQHVTAAPAGFSQIKAVCDGLGALPVEEPPPSDEDDEPDEGEETTTTTTTTRPPPIVPGCTAIDSSDPTSALLFLRSAGGELFTDGDTAIDGPAAHEGADFLADRVADGVLVPVAGAQAAVATFVAGDVAYLLAPAVIRHELSAAGVPYTLGPLPLITGEEPAPWLEAFAFFLAADTPHPDEATLFLLEYLAAAPGMAEIFAAEGAVPAHGATADLAASDPEVAVLLDIAAHARPIPTPDTMAAVLAILQVRFAALFEAEPDVEAILTTAADAVRAVL